MRLLTELESRIEECRTCGGTGLELGAGDNACGTCGGQGETLDATPLIQDIREAAAKVRETT